MKSNIAYLLDFKNVGRDKKCWQSEIEFFDEEVIAGLIVNNGALISKNIRVGLDYASKCAIIWVGGRQVGSFTWEEKFKI